MSAIATPYALRVLLCCALLAFAATGCGGGAPSVEPAPGGEGPPAFSPERFDANLRALVALGPRPQGSAALVRARAWALARSPARAPPGALARVAPLATDATEDGAPVAVAFDAPPPPALAGATAAVWVQRACATPARRDLLSHRVLRERFFREAGVDAIAFEQSDAPLAELAAAGAARTLALDGPAAPGQPCSPTVFGDALVRFVSDATALLNRTRTP